MKTLYLSCHSILEFDEVKLFTELGHEVVSVGAYSNPSKPEDDKRPPIPNAFYNPELASLTFVKDLYGEVDKKLIDWCDVVVATQHMWIYSNWHQMKHKPVIYRTIGQTSPIDEATIAKYRREGLKIVRWSEAERRIPNYAGEDAVIRAYKDPEEWGGWNGKEKRVITIGQAMVKRNSHMKFHIFEKATRGLPRKLYGPKNEEAGELWGGFLSYEEMQSVLRDSRVFMATCTNPSPYTLSFVEAFITGCPIVAIGRRLAGYSWFETSDIIEDGISGYVSDSILELRNAVFSLLEDYDLAKRISEAGRRRAIEFFGKERALKEWRLFLNAV